MRIVVFLFLFLNFCFQSTVFAHVQGIAYEQDAGTNGLVVIEAESYDANITRNGQTWQKVTPTGKSGAYAMQALPNKQNLRDTGYTTTSPQLNYTINFQKTGTHYVWIRGLGATADDNSLHVGLNNAAVTSADRVGNFTPTFSWLKTTADGPAATINIPSKGSHTLNLWMREDGLVVDKIILTTSLSYVPTSLGPTENLQGKPVLNAPTAGNAQITLAWSAVTLASGYHLKYGTSPGVYTNTLDVKNVTSYTLKNLTNGTKYYFSVSAYNSTGSTANNNEASATPISSGFTPTLFVKKIEYNAAGMPVRSEYGNGTITTHTYDTRTLRLKRLHTTNTQNVALQDLNYTHDVLGNILTIVDKVNSADQTFKYDHRNRLTAATGERYGSLTYSYDGIGNIITKEGVTYTYSKVNAGPHAVTSLSNGTTLSYDLNGNLSTMVKAGESTAYTFDAENRLTEARKNNELLAKFEYDGDGGRVRKISYTNANAETCFLGGTQVVMADGSVKKIEDVRVNDYVLSLNEKTLEKVSARVVKMFNTEKASEHVLLNGQLKVTANHQFYNKGEWTPIGDLTPGALLLNDELKEFPIEKIEKVQLNKPIAVYNLEVEGEHNYFVRPANDAGTNSTAYLVHNKMALEGGATPTGTATVYVGSLFETTAGASMNHVYAGAQKIATISNHKLQYNHTDHLGGTNVVSDRFGASQELVEYKPFGEFSRREFFGNPERTAMHYFTHHRLDDETGLYFMQARYYNPVLGKFITPDTIVQNPQDPQTLNRYSYTSNNPINRVDPTGHKWSWKKFFSNMVGAVIGVVAAVLSAGTLTPIIGAFWAGVAGGAIGGALSGGISTALQGGSWSQIGMSALMGAGLGAIGGGIAGSSLSNLTKGIIGGVALVGGGAYAASTGNLDSFLGGLVGSITGAGITNSMFGNESAGNATSEKSMKDVSAQEIVKATNDIKDPVVKAELVKEVVKKANQPTLKPGDYRPKLSGSDVSYFDIVKAGTATGMISGLGMMLAPSAAVKVAGLAILSLSANVYTGATFLESIFQGNGLGALKTAVSALVGKGAGSAVSGSAMKAAVESVAESVSDIAATIYGYTKGLPGLVQ